MVRDLHLAGVSVTGDNVLDRDQVLAMTSAITDAAAADGRDYPPVIGVDQEGGYVSHLRGIATDFPHFQSAGLAIAADARLGRRVTRAAALATGLELRDLGFTWVFAPVADVTIGAADPTIGARSPSRGPPARVPGHRRGHQGLRRRRASSRPSSTSRATAPRPATATTRCRCSTRRSPRSRRTTCRPSSPPFASHAPAVMMSHLDLTDDRAGRARQHGARGVRPAARRPRLRGRHHHRLARHGCRRRPAHAGPAGAAGRGRPAPDAGRHRDHAPDRHRRDRLAATSRGRGSRRPPPASWRSRCGRRGWQHNGPSPPTWSSGHGPRARTWSPRRTEDQAASRSERCVPGKAEQRRRPSSGAGRRATRTQPGGRAVRPRGPGRRRDGASAAPRARAGGPARRRCRAGRRCRRACAGDRRRGRSGPG